MVLPSCYMPQISWFARLMSDEPIWVEQWANYRKQTYHNRCWIDSPNGKLSLTVPVDRSTFVDGKCLMKDVKVSYHTDWQRQHWYAIESSYFNSPFFEYLQDDFHPIYLKRWEWLMDLNETIVDKCCKLIDIKADIKRTDEYRENLSDSLSYPLRLPLLRGRELEALEALETPEAPETPEMPEYYQVFAHKHGFLPDLSIIDLIFNLGPESILYLQKVGQWLTVKG